MANFKIIKSIKLGSEHMQTGKTIHYQGDDLIQDITELKIVQYLEDSGYYLIYLNSLGQEVTDTYHETIESAVKQAQFEFDVMPNEWH